MQMRDPNRKNKLLMKGLFWFFSPPWKKTAAAAADQGCKRCCFDKFSVFISIAWRRRRRRRSSSSFEPVHFVGSRLGTTFAFSFLVVMLLGVVEEEEELWSFRPQACCSGEDGIGHGDECGVVRIACNRVRSRRSRVSTWGTEGPHTWRRTPLISPRPTAQIASVSPLRWRNMTAKISTSASSAELVSHSSYYSSSLPEILPSAPQIFPCLLALIFPFFFSFFSFLPLINKTIKESKTFKKKRFNSKI